MTAQKAKDSGSPQSATATTQVTPGTAKRKTWIKKTPVEVVLTQINRVREDVAARKEKYELAKRQLEKLEAARKVLEGT
jgi:hypothetical protein